MPSEYIQRVSSETGKSVDKLEALFAKAKGIAGKQNRGEDYGYITGIFQKMVKESIQTEQEMTLDESKFKDPEELAAKQAEKQKQQARRTAKRLGSQQKREVVESLMLAIMNEDIEDTKELFQILFADKLAESIEARRIEIAEEMFAEKAGKFDDGESFNKPNSKKKKQDFSKLRTQKRQPVGIEEAVSPESAHKVISMYGVKPSDSFFSHGDDVTSKIARDGRRMGIKHNASSRASGKSEDRHIFDRLTSIAAKHEA